MDAKLFANPFRPNQFLFPHITPSFGKHVGALQDFELEQQRNEFLSVNRQILPGFGKHRKNRVTA